MKRVATALVLIPLVLFLVFKGPDWLMALVLAAIALVCVAEYENILQAQAIEPAKRLLRVFVTLPFLAPLLYGVPGFRALFAPFAPFSAFSDIAVLVAIPIYLLAPFCFVLALMSQELTKCIPGAGASLLGLLYVGGSLFSLWILWLGDFGSLLVLHVLVVVWSGDIFAYFVGKNLGRRKLAPKISPGKTWEGTIASLLGAGALGTFILLNLQPLHDWLLPWGFVPPIGWIGWPSALPKFPLWFALAATLTVNVAAQLGDLVESALKRGANVKDSGAILPGHGGLLDRIDALLFASPVAVLVFAIGKRLFSSNMAF